jgi:D-glycero-alpha-D-manno-heptose 1-phosphate guanylyltransferase
MSAKIDVPMFVLAGGLGTRLRSVVPDVPKPLAPVQNKPFLSYLVNNWIDQGVREFIFLLHYGADQIIKFLENSEFKKIIPDVNFSYVVEPFPLGTGGAVKSALKQYSIDGPFLVANADTWLGKGVEQLIVSPSPCIATVAVSNISRYGEVRTNDGIVESFTEKCQTNKQGQVNAGMYLLSAAHFLESIETTFSIETTILPNLVATKKLRAITLDCNFIDIGIPEDYRNFCNWVR